MRQDHYIILVSQNATQNITLGEVQSLLNSCHKYTYFKCTLGKEKAVTQEPVLEILILNPAPPYPSVSQA